MNKVFKIACTFSFILLTISGYFNLTSANDYKDCIMDRYNIYSWLNAGAKVTYDTLAKEVIVKKDRMEPGWGGTILEIGIIDLGKDNYLKFEVADLKGLYAVLVHYGGWQQYEAHKVKIQEDTTIMGQQEYNISEALRMEGLSGKQQIAIQILVIDPQDEPGKSMVCLKGLRLESK